MEFFAGAAIGCLIVAILHAYYPELRRHLPAMMAASALFVAVMVAVLAWYLGEPK